MRDQWQYRRSRKRGTRGSHKTAERQKSSQRKENGTIQERANLARLSH